MNQPGDYPARWEADVALGDGGVVHVRPVRPEDAPAVAVFHARQPAEDQYRRYFTSMPTLTPRMLERLTMVDYVEHLGFVALLGDDIVGMASYDMWPERNAAEVAFMVDHEHRGRGLATVLLEYLVVAAREIGIPTLLAMVLPTNQGMLTVFRAAGFQSSSTFDEGVTFVGRPSMRLAAAYQSSMTSKRSPSPSAIACWRRFESWPPGISCV